MLQQMVPSSYLWLEKTVTKLKCEWDKSGRPPVISNKQFLYVIVVVGCELCG